ncbi:MAG: YCF48-related protein, partial [Thermoanaerobaculia bacterium]|nr:YCF48-related protein [Thermoanaerobaculia bacterium]
MTSFRISATCLLFACCCALPFQSAAQACWAHVTPKYSNSSLLDVFFADSLHGWTVGALDSIYKTIDGGETWMPKASGT